MTVITVQMGTTHGLYRLKERNVSISDVFADLKLINDSLCIGDKKTFHHQFVLQSPEIVEQLNSVFDTNFYQLHSTFNLSNYDLLLGLLETVSHFKRISFSNKLEFPTVRNYLHYWMEIDQSKLSVSIVPSITEGFLLMKKELIEILDFLRSHKLINLKNDELISLLNNLIDTNLRNEERINLHS